MPQFDTSPWLRKHDDSAFPAVPAPQRHYFPASRANLIEIVQTAEGMPSPVEVRASGSHWALSDAALTEDFIVETQEPPQDGPSSASRPKLNKTLYEVVGLNGCLTTGAWKFFGNQGVHPFDPTAPLDLSKFYVYHVEAGTRIYELYCRLDTGDDNIRESLAFELPDYKGPWAMPTLGGAGGQTIVGALSTGTHGGDVLAAPVADAVQAIHLIGPEEKQYWLERLLPNGAAMVEDEALKKLYGPIEISRDAEFFNSVLVSAGRMGIIYSVVLRVVRQYALKEDRTADTWSNVKTWVKNPSHPNFSNRFVQVVVNPNSQVDNKAEHTCYVTFRNALPMLVPPAPMAGGRAERCGVNAGTSVPFGDDPGDFFNSICASDSPAKAALTGIIQDFETVRDDALITAAIAAAAAFFFPPAAAVAAAATTVAIAAEGVITILDQLRSSLPPGPLGNTIGAICNWAADNDRFEFVRRLTEVVMASEQKPRTLTGIGYAIMDIHNYEDVGCSANGDSLEVFFDAASPNVVAFAERLFQRIWDLENGTITGKRLAFAGYVSMRFMAQSEGLIAMQKFPRSCAFEIAGFKAVLGTEPYLAQVEMDAVEMGATVHWGQRNSLTMEMVEKVFDAHGPSGALFRWRRSLSKLSRNGRVPTFSTDFTRRRGLEVVEPITQDFTVNPSVACAGSLVQVGWIGSDNPAGTRATVETRPSGSTGPPATSLDLATLDGSQDIPLPTGETDFTLTLSYTFNSRTLTDARTVTARGIQDGDVWPTDAIATCMSIDGQWRWATELAFDPNDFSSALEVEELRLSAVPFGLLIPQGWYVRKSGMPDALISWVGGGLHRYSFSGSKPPLTGLWTFFDQNTGCTGVAPHLYVELTLACTP